MLFLGNRDAQKGPKRGSDQNENCVYAPVEQFIVTLEPRSIQVTRGKVKTELKEIRPERVR